MQRRTLILMALVVVVGVFAAVRVLDDEPARDGWQDCTAPRLQETLPTRAVGDRIALSRAEEISVPMPTSLIDAGDRVLVSSLSGEITDVAASEVVLDLSDDVIVDGEWGLYDIDLSPDGDWLYASYGAAPDGRSTVRAWAWPPPEGDTLDPDDGVDILELDQPHFWHNGGGMAFGPDGLLYVGFGDGGSDDPGDTVRAQDLSTLYGTIVRIDPTPEDGGGYEVPDSNPFVGRDDAAPEILHYGLRNPWRFTFDADDSLWISDVGQYCVEEVDIVRDGVAGLNFGWPGLEGTYEFAFAPPEDPVAPAWEYLHVGFDTEKTVCSMSGGEFYRGTEIDDLRDVYVFADLCDGKLRGIRLDDGVMAEYDLDLTVASPVAVAGDDDGNVYVMAFEDGGIVVRVGPG